jgi:AcrR family transcriptional regulator
VVGLRERNKARTRAEIRRHAMRLFREQGYAATTVDQIVKAAEVSQSTFFRYFPAKEDVVLRDDYDPLIIEAFESQPSELSPIQAIRAAIRTVIGGLSAEDIAQELERHKLILSTPDLRVALLDEFSRSITLFAEMVAKRIGRDPGDFAVRTFAGGLIGVSMSTMLTLSTAPEGQYLELFDTALAHLEAGLPL